MIISIQDLKKKKDYKNPKSYSLYFGRQLKKEKLIRIEKGMYSTMDTPVFEIASNILYPSYISLWSASAYYGFTEQIPNIIQVITTKQKKPLNAFNTPIKFIKCSPSWMYGYKRENNTFMASHEKLLIDCLRFQKEMGNFDEISSIARNIEIDKNAIEDYLKKAKNISLIKRAGFILEKERKISIYGSFKDALIKDKNYTKLSLFDKKPKKLDSKWKIKY